jgi:hypothetical protein
MLDQYAIVPVIAQAVVPRRDKEVEPGEFSHRLGMHLLHFLEPLVHELDVTVDKRPLRTLVQTVEAMVALGDRNHGILLSELGDYMDGLGRGGGTKRRSRLNPPPGVASPTDRGVSAPASRPPACVLGGPRGGRVAEMPMAPCWKSRKALPARGCVPSARAKRCGSPASKRATITRPASLFLCRDFMASACCWLVARNGKGRRCWRPSAAGRRVARWPVMSEMKPASSCACLAAAGAIASSMSLIAAMVAVGGWEPCVASTRALSCAWRDQ